MFQDDGLLTTTKLRVRGWSAGMIEKFLPEPDETAKNPHYRTGPPMRLYALGRIEQIEASGDWKIAREKAARRSAIARTASAKRENELIERAKSQTIRIPQIDLSEIEIRAIDSWIAHKNMLRREIDGVPADTERLMVNYLRHECSSYERWLNKFHGKPGAEEARWIIRREVYAQIAETYPTLAPECRRQIREREEREEERMYAEE